ncbi:MAG: uL30 family ribosomal protein [Nanoarchaeota archaeon]|nr:uL30 family ribosomal protein [Nanoarchaeota archaeon]
MAVILVRGFIRVNKKVVDTCKMLTLYRKNYCTLVDKKDFGMVNKIKDYVTFGEIDKETEKLLIEKKGEMKKGRDGKDVMKRFFRLNPPKKGFGRKGIKVSFSKSGALGYRGNKINELIKRML